VPVQVVSIVILDHNKKRSRAYYEGDFEEGKNAAPKCFSGDGEKPDPSVAEPCAATCATCPHSVKGSKMSSAGKPMTACAPYKRVAVMPSASILAPGSHVPLLLRLAQTSVWDKDNKHEAEGYYAWDQYLDMLRARGAKHTAAVETRVKFDVDVAYPKLLFSANRWLNPDETAAVLAKLKTDADAITGIINGKQSEDGVTGQPAAPSTPAAAAQPDAATQAAAQAQAQAAAAAEAEAQKKAAAAAAKAAKVAAAQAAAKAAAAAAEAAAAAAAEDDGADWGAAAVAAPVATAVTAQAAVSVAPTPAATVGGTPAEVIESGTPASLKGLLDAWDA